jgi:uncharacterized membrane protein YfcA
MAGMGGGFVMIPLMRHQFVMSQHAAHGTSLCAVVAIGLAGAVTYWDQIHVPAACAVSATAIVTAQWGARVTRYLSGRALQRAMGGLFLVMAPVVPAKAYAMERYYQYHHLRDTDEQYSKTKQPEQQQQSAVLAAAHGTNKHASLNSATDVETITAVTLLQSTDVETITAVTLLQSAEIVWTSLSVPAAIGIVSGFLAGLFGGGGGTVVVPALVLGMGDDHNKFTYHQALATSLAAMVLPAAVGTWTHAQVGNVAWRVAPPLALGALVGAYFGGKVALQTKEGYLQWGFAALLAVLGIRTLWNA